VCSAVFRFLDVEERTVRDLGPENEGGAMRLQILQNWYVRNATLRNLVMRVTSQSLRKSIYRLNRRRSANYRLSPADRWKYSGLFVDDIRRVEQEYGIAVA
jgi:hypothetical protein